MALGGQFLGQEGRERACAGSDRTTQAHHPYAAGFDLAPHRAEHSNLPIAAVHGPSRRLEGCGQHVFDLGTSQGGILGQHPRVQIA